MFPKEIMFFIEMSQTFSRLAEEVGCFDSDSSRFLLVLISNLFFSALSPILVLSTRPCLLLHFKGSSFLTDLPLSFQISTICIHLSPSLFPFRLFLDLSSFISLPVHFRFSSLNYLHPVLFFCTLCIAPFILCVRHLSDLIAVFL